MQTTAPALTASSAATALSPPQSPSPCKRRRSAPPGPSTPPTTAASGRPPRSGSPWAVVAEQLQGLDLLHCPGGKLHGAAASAPQLSPRKRPRRDDYSCGDEITLPPPTWEASMPEDLDPVNSEGELGGGGGGEEAGGREESHFLMLMSASSPARLLPSDGSDDDDSPRQHDAMAIGSSACLAGKKRYASPPPPQPCTHPDGAASGAGDLHTSALGAVDAASASTSSSPSSPLSSWPSDLTWHDYEITGHEIDRANLEDDGEGINGIGFRPTPAMAYARSQRRRQQVSEWRAREAREARQRRLERRRGGETAAAGESRPPARPTKRVVRFAEA